MLFKSFLFNKSAKSFVLLVSVLTLQLNAKASGGNIDISESLKTGATKPEVLTAKTMRCSGKKYLFSKYPDYLEGATSIALPRGNSKKPFEGYTFESSVDITVFLFVQKRGAAKIPGEWEKLKETAEWKFSKYKLKDDIYRKQFGKGTVQIPGHYGQSGGNYGAPHFIVIVPATK